MSNLSTEARRRALMDILRMLQEEEKKKLLKKKGVPKQEPVAPVTQAPTNSILDRMLQKKAELKK